MAQVPQAENQARDDQDQQGGKFDLKHHWRVQPQPTQAHAKARLG